MTSEYLWQIFNADDVTLQGLGSCKQVAIKHMHTVGTTGPLQLAIHVAQNRDAEEEKSHWDKTNQRHNFKW